LTGWRTSTNEDDRCRPPARTRESLIFHVCEIAKSVGALLFVDMAAHRDWWRRGVHPSPVPHADFVSTTTHKNIARARGGLVLCTRAVREDWDKLMFPEFRRPLDAHDCGEGRLFAGSNAAGI